MEKWFVDTNIFLRHLTWDDPSKGSRCKEIFQKATEGKITLITSGLVIAELVWTLLSYYRVPKADVVEKISIIVSTKSLHISDKDIIVDSLLLYSRKNIDYIDAYNAVFMTRHGLDKLYSYDADFDMIDGLERNEP